MRLSEKEYEQLKATGKFRNIIENKSAAAKSKSILPKKTRNKAKEKIDKDLWAFAMENNLVIKKEFRFHPERMWRFDWCFPSLKIAIEYEGLMSEKSRHTTISGFTGDAEKYNAAQQLGWKVMRYTAKNYRSILSDLKKLLCQRN